MYRYLDPIGIAAVLALMGLGDGDTTGDDLIGEVLESCGVLADQAFTPFGARDIHAEIDIWVAAPLCPRQGEPREGRHGHVRLAR